MKKTMAKISALLIMITLFMSLSMMNISAAKSVDLLGNQKAAYSGSVKGRWKYVNKTTKNFKTSSQRMRAQFEVRNLTSLIWNSENRIFVNKDKTAPYFETNHYASDKYFRLALSPEDGIKKGVFGTGSIYH